MTLAEDLARMEAEDAAATPGPWSREDEPSPAGYGDGRYENVVASDGKVVVQDWQPGHPRERFDQDNRNLDLIASARTDRPALVRMVRKLAERFVQPDGYYSREQLDGILELVWSEAKKKAGGR